MSGCGCHIRWEHNELSGSEGDAMIAYCALHESATFWFTPCIAMLKEVLESGFDMPLGQRERIEKLISKASQPGKESK